MTFGAEGVQALLVRVGTHACAVPVSHVAEIMRPLAVQPLAGVPGFVVGVSVVRGVAIPVIDLARLLNATSGVRGRFVTVKIGARRAALVVDSVVGLRILDPARLGELPGLLRSAETDVIEAIGASDAQLLVVIRAMRIVPNEVWTVLESPAAAP